MARYSSRQAQGMNLLQFMVYTRMVASYAEGRRVIYQGGVRLNGNITQDLPVLDDGINTISYRGVDHEYFIGDNNVTNIQDDPAGPRDRGSWPGPRRFLSWEA